MRHLIIVCLLFSLGNSSFGQISVSLKKETPLQASEFIGVDAFENIYYLEGDVLYKKNGTTVFSYSNLNLGRISSVDITDPTKIVIFYQDFLSAEILNRNLIKIETIAFFDLNITFLRKATGSLFWIYSDVSQKLILYDYRLKRIVLESEILQGFEVEEIYSTFNYCWLVTSDNRFLELDSQLNILQIFDKIPVQEIRGKKGRLLLKSESKIYQLSSDKILKKIEVSAKGIHNFYLIENYLYIFERKEIKLFEISKKD